METAKQPNKRSRGVSLLSMAAILLTVVPSCAPIESGSSRGQGADDVPRSVLRVENHGRPGPKDIRAAERALKKAYGTAQTSRLWESMFEVADGYARIGDAAKARRCYLIALYRARREGSVDGVLRVAEALTVLGERETAEQVLAIAQRLADQTIAAPSLRAFN